MKWENPPAQVRAGRQPCWEKEAAELREHPREWAVLAEYPAGKAASAYGIATAIRYGRRVAFSPAGAFEAAVRKRGDRIKIYVRYTGEPS